MTENDPNTGYLTGQLLVAMPAMSDPRFERSVIYMCAHTEDGAMGLVINRELESISFPDLLEQIGIEATPPKDAIRILFGGPVEQSRGFVLHSTDYKLDDTLEVHGGIALTASVDILRAIAEGHGPAQSLLVLGYAGWGPGQLEGEIQQNGWLHAPADTDLVFGIALEARWDASLARIGISPSALSGQAGHA
ncbi:MAG: YqgE/AlgH family protein [Proteobacteria bacterium]|nr:YqgE/AlgH family protein [Pseudomonadota bacterium]